MDRHLFLVAHDQADLWAYLQREFSAEENVEVILDRREGRDRRIAPRSSEQGAQDRRAADRRVRGAVDAQLRLYGYAMLNVGTTPAPTT